MNYSNAYDQPGNYDSHTWLGDSSASRGSGITPWTVGDGLHRENYQCAFAHQRPPISPGLPSPTMLPGSYAHTRSWSVGLPAGPAPRAAPNSPQSADYSRTDGSSGSWGSRQRRASNRDEFDGPSQQLPNPFDGHPEPTDTDIPLLTTSVAAHEQDDIFATLNRILSQCAFNFVARYQFRIPLEQGKRPIQNPSDREWSEWAHLLKRLATKRRIPSRVLYHGDIRNLHTILESSIAIQPMWSQSRPPVGDRHLLQLISAGEQVARALMDVRAMESVKQVYLRTELLISGRRNYSS